MDIIGVEIDFYVPADTETVKVSFAGLGTSRDDFMKLSHGEKCELVRNYVAQMQYQPTWIINDFCYIQKQQDDKG